MSSLDIFLDLALIFFLLLTVLNYRAHRSVLYPPFIFCGMWLLDLALLRSGLIEIDPVHGNTLAIVAAGAASFSAGGLLAGLAPKKLLRIHLFPPKPKRTSDFLRNALIIFLLCGLPVLFYRTLQLSKSVGGNLNIFAKAGLASLEASQSGQQSQSLLLDHIGTIAVGACLLFATEKKDRKFWIMAVVTFITSILNGGRSVFLLLIPGLCAIYMLHTKQESLKCAIRFLRWPIAVFVALFIGQNFIGKSSESMTLDIADQGVVRVGIFFVLDYIVGPLAAFDKVVQHPANFIMPMSHTFQSPMRLAAALHLITNYTKPPQFDSFVYIPFSMNVYTVYKYDFVELGIVWTLVIMLIIGMIHSLLYLKAKQGGRFSTYLFAYSMYTVLLVIYDDHYYAVDGLLRAIAMGLLYFLIGSVPFRLFPAIKLRHQLKSNHLESSSV